MFTYFVCTAGLMMSLGVEKLIVRGSYLQVSNSKMDCVDVMLIFAISGIHSLSSSHVTWPGVNGLEAEKYLLPDNLWWGGEIGPCMMSSVDALSISPV